MVCAREEGGRIQRAHAQPPFARDQQLEQDLRHGWRHACAAKREHAAACSIGAARGWRVPSSASTFRDVIAELAKLSYVSRPTCPASALRSLAEAHVRGIRRRDPRAAVSLERRAALGVSAPLRGAGRHHVAMKAPDSLLGLIVQNANAHRSGFGPRGERRSPTGHSRMRRTKRQPLSRFE
jgi:hypothetical protein